MDSYSVDTWTTGIGLVTWEYISNAKFSIYDNRFYLLVADLIDSAATGFASISRISFTSRSMGEDAFILDRCKKGSEGFEASVVVDDIVRLDFDLDINCLGLGDSEFLINGGISIMVEVGDNDEVGLDLSLNVDLFSPKSTALNSNNYDIAVLNNPRLVRFQKNLMSLFELKLVDIDGQHYRGVVTEFGFIVNRNQRVRVN